MADSIFKFDNSKTTHLRNYLYVVEFGGLLSAIKSNQVESVTIPEFGVGDEEKLSEFGGVRYNSHNHSAPQLQLTIREMAHSNVMNSLMMMKKGFVKMDGSKAQVFSLRSGRGATSVIVKMFHMNGKLARVHKFTDCTLSSATQSNLSSTGSGEAITIDVTLNIGRWTC